MKGDQIIIQDIHHKKVELILPFVIKNYYHNKFIITIGAESGSGKSEVAHLLQKELFDKHRIRSKIIQLDDYYKTNWIDRNKIRKKNGVSSVGIKEIDWGKITKIISDYKNIRKKYLNVEYIHKYLNVKEYSKVENKHIDVLIFEGLYANDIECKDLGVYLDSTIKETEKFRKLRNKEKLNEFRKLVLEQERKDVLRTKKKSNLIISFDGNVI